VLPAPVVPNTDNSAAIDELRDELNTQDAVLQEIWAILPTTHARMETGLVDRETHRLKSQVVSPSVDIDLEALRAVYLSPSGSNGERYSDPQAIVNRIKIMIEDGQILVERVVRAGKERELLKSNASRAQRLVEEGQANLKTYQKSVRTFKRAGALVC
jgi:hypothetical protein